MPRRLGLYDHLNQDPIGIPVTIPQLVTLVLSLNYGSHRFLSEWVRQREAEHAKYILALKARGDFDVIPIANESETVRLTRTIERALEEGGF